MDVLHGVWQPDENEGLHVWIESRTGYLKAQKMPKDTNYHPYALEHLQLFNSLHEYLQAPYSRKELEKKLFLSLPVKNSHIPLASFEKATEQKKFPLSHWQIPSLLIPKDKVLAFLAALGTKSPSFTVGSSLEYWRTLGLFALELIHKGAFYPALKLIDGEITYKACWKPFLTEKYSTELVALSQPMPALCQSFAIKEYEPSLLIEQFLEETVDAFIKKNLSDISAFSNLTPPQNPINQAFQGWLTQLSLQEDSPQFSLLSNHHRATDTFITQLQEWTKRCETPSETAGDQVQASSKKQFSIIFQLNQPVDLSSTWKLFFLLQASDDQSLILSAEDIWSYKPSSHGVLTFYENPQERLLRDIARASHIVLAFQKSLEEEFPTHIELTTQEAYSFLHNEAHMLQDKGFILHLPVWWNKTRKRLSSHVHIRRSLSQGMMDSSSILEYDWKMSLGEQSLSEQEFKELAALKEPLVKVRGEWVEVDQKEIATALSFFQKKQKKELSLIEALQLSLGKEDPLTGVSLETVTTEEWFDDFLKKLQDPQKIASVMVPENFNGQLRPYQERGLSWLSFLKTNSFGACLADDMGLGKTIQVIALLLHEKKTTPFTVPHLLICPMSVLGNWQQELEKFAPSITVMIHHSAKRLSAESFKEEALKHDIVITTYSLSARDHEELLSITWKSLILDEAQNIKNSSSKQTQVIKTLQAQSKLALTGTPIENRLGELWSLMDFLNKGYLGSEDKFHKKFTAPIERNNDQQRAAALKNLIQPFILRRVKTDKSIIQDLPDKIETKELCYLTKEQATLYQSVLDTMLKTIENAEGIERKGLVLSTLLKLKQICNHPVNFIQDNSSLEERSGKLNRLEELLEEILAEGGKSLIFTQFATMGHLLHKHLTSLYKKEVLYLYGGTPKKARDKMIEQFQTSEGPSIFVLSLKAGGTGLNLTQANHVFHFDRWWNPAVENQATDRAFRIGQKKMVQVHKFVCAGTLEDRIDRLIEQKKQLTDLVISAGEHWITELSTDELKELFTLAL
ncbi:DEAD/DEAH box helicase [Candidatus Dependentiae bacterium]|nr:DEAD/DEAH box helicase [Candidatus Dependentiae bacterium]